MSAHAPPVITHAAFSVGQVIHHRLFDYRGVIIGIDPEFHGTESWYRKMARSRPPRDRPWYHVLVHDKAHQTYVAEQNLEPDATGLPVAHPMLQLVLGNFRDGGYDTKEPAN